MTSKAVKLLTLNALIFMAGSVLAPLAQAQQVYRIVGPDGKVTFSDQPPPAASTAPIKWLMLLNFSPWYMTCRQSKPIWY